LEWQTPTPGTCIGQVGTVFVPVADQDRAQAERRR
jgi:hypothetical protein